MGLFSKILPIIGIAAAIATGGALGIVAGALMATSFAAQHGWLGKGAQNFANSSLGSTLVTTIGLASMAMGAYSAMTAPATIATAGAQEAGSMAAGAADTASAAGGAADMASGGAALQAGSDTLAAAPTVSNSIESISSVPVQDTINSLAGGNPEAAIAHQADIATANQAASGTTASLAQETGNATSAQAVKADSMAVNSTVAPQTPSSIAQGSSNFNGAAGAPAAPTTLAGKAGGMLSDAASFIGKNPGVATMAGSAISGMAQGAAQQKMMEEQLAANQWGNSQWELPGQVAGMQKAAAAPITVPNGYLARAAAARNLVNNSTNNGPAAPAAGGGAGTVAPVGMASNGPVPVAGMGAAPKGGVA